MTDNAPVMVKAWRLIREKFPHIFAVGCASHGLDLLMEHIMLKIKPFRELRKKVLMVVKIKMSRKTKAVFKSKQEEKYGKNAPTLCLPSKTRFAADKLMFASVLCNKDALLETAISDRAGIKPATKAIIFDDGFWVELSHVLDLLIPISRGIHVLEGDSGTFPLVVRVFMDILTVFKNKLPELPVDYDESVCNTVYAKLKETLDFTLKDIHKAAYLVDPRFCGEGLSDEEVLDSFEVIRSIAGHFGFNVEQVNANFMEFRAKSGFFARELLWKNAASADCNPLTWWKVFCNNQAATPVSEVLLQLHPTSARSERTWSDFGFIHSKRRNRLHNERVKKHVAVRKNLQRKVAKSKSGKSAAKLAESIKYYRELKPVPLVVQYDDEDILLGQGASDEEEEEYEYDDSSEFDDSDSNDDEYDNITVNVSDAELSD